MLIPTPRTAAAFSLTPIDTESVDVGTPSVVMVLLPPGRISWDISSSSHTLSTKPVRTNAQSVHVVRNRARHHPEEQRGYIVELDCEGVCWWVGCVGVVEED